MRRPCHAQELALAVHRHLRMVLLDQAATAITVQALQLFFLPIVLNLKLADFAVQFLLALRGLRVVVAPLAEELRQTIGDLLLPGGDLGRVYLESGCDHVDGLNTLERFQRDPGLEPCTVVTSL